MKSAIVFIGLIALTACAMAEMDDHDMLIEEMRKLAGSSDFSNRTVGDLAHEIVRESRMAWHDVKEFIEGAVKQEKKTGRAGRALNEEEEISVKDLLKRVAALYGARQARAEEASSGNEIDEENKGDSYARQNKPGGFGGALVQKPVLIPIPGPPGPPGPPGVPGLPGIPGKSPNLKGLKAILLARLAKVLLLIKALLVLCFGLNAAILATTLGLTLPAYKKFKKAGVVVPVDEEPNSYGYEQQAYQQEPAPTGPYGRRSGRADGSFAPVSSSYLQNTQNGVFSALDKGNANFGKN